MSRLVWTAALALVLAIAAWRGGRDERLTAVALLTANFVGALHRGLFWRFDWISPVLDLALLSFLGGLAAVTTRWWPLYACSAQLAACLGGLAFAITKRPMYLSYHLNAVLWSYGILAALLIGTLFEQARIHEERTASDLGWSG